MAAPPAQNPKPEKILVSWKEIAAFLNRAERTVKRWERERGLPVHRVPGGERGGVYAYPSELTDWLNGKSTELESDDSAAGEPEAGVGAETATAGAAAASEGPVPSRPGEPGGHIGRLGHSLKTKLAVAGLAAALAGAGIYAILAHPFGDWIERRFSAIASIAPASSNRQVVAPVSDAEKSLAHNLYLKGQFEWNQRTPDSLNRALDDFTQAIVHNPNDAHAYAGLADAYEMLYIYGNRQDDDARDRAMAAARKAVALDDSLPEAHRALGYAAWRGGDFPEAERELHLAIQLNPKDALAHLWLSNVLASQAENDECLAEINKAQELDPASASTLAVKGDRLYWMGAEQEGMALLEEAVHSEPRLAIAHWYLAAIAFSRRDYPMYLKESETTAEIRNDAWLKAVTAKLSNVYAHNGERSLLNTQFAVQESCSPPAYQVFRLTKTAKAFECLRRGRKPEALQLFEEASANQEREFEDLRAAFTSGPQRDLHERLSGLADDPRFQSLMKQKNDLPKSAKLPTSTDSGNL